MIRDIFYTAIIGALAFLGVAYVMSPAQNTEFVELKTDTQLARVYFVNDPEATQLHGTLVLHRGEADMTGPEGLAHYIEHLVTWNALPNRKATDQRDFNAYTETTNTNYYMNGENQDEVMSYLAGVFSPIKLDEKFMKEEAGIVKREFEQSDSENKFAPFLEQLDADIFKGTGMARSVIGKPDDIINFDPQTAIKAFEEHYYPQNADLVLGGNMSKEEATKLVNQYFSAIKRENPPARALDDQKLENQDSDQQTLTLTKLPNGLAVSTWIIPFEEPASKKINARQNMIAMILSSEQKHMFARKLIHEDKNYSSFYAYFVNMPAKFGHHLDISGEIRNDKKPEYLAHDLKQWVELIEKNPEYLQPVMQGYIAQSKKSFEKLKPEDFYNNIVDNLSRDITPQGVAADYIAELEKITPQDIIDDLKKITAQSGDISRIYLK